MTPEEIAQWDMEKLLFFLPCKMDKAIKKITESVISDSPLKSYHCHVLTLISMTDGITQKEINADVPFDKSRISVIVHELIDMGMVTDSGEGRSSCLHLTPKGLEALDEARGYASEAKSRIFSVFSEEELNKVCEFFIKLDTHLDEINNE